MEGTGAHRLELISAMRGWTAGVACGAGFVVLAILAAVGWTPLTDFDVRIVRDLHEHVLANRWELPYWRGVSTALGPTPLRLAALVAGAVLWIRGARTAAVTVLLAIAGTAVLSPLTKQLVDRDRPMLADPIAHASGQSFPSGHALTSFVAAGVVVMLCTPPWRRRLVVPLAVLVLAVGLSRMLLGVHYLSDVVGGWLLGTAWLGVVVPLVRRSRFAARVRP